MKLTKKLLALVHCASQDETRYNLNGIYFDGDGTSVATDGHVLGRIVPFGRSLGRQDRPTKGSAFILALEAVKDLIRRTKAKGSSVMLDVDDKRSRSIQDAEHRNTYEVIDGEFPKWKQIHKKPSKAATKHTLCLSAEVLEKVLAASRQFTGTTKGAALKLEFTFVEDNLAPVFIEVLDKETSDSIEFSAMPMRKA